MSIHSRRLIAASVLTILIVLNICVQAHAAFHVNGRYGKRNNQKQNDVQQHIIKERSAKYYGGSRYGRSDPSLQISARAGRFYGGTRYGKRDDTPVDAVPSILITTDIVDGSSSYECIYTDIVNYYRCSKKEDPGSDGPLN